MEYMTPDQTVTMVRTADLAALVDRLAAVEAKLDAIASPTPDWLPLPAYAERAGRSVGTVRRWIAQGKAVAETRGNVRGVRV